MSNPLAFGPQGATPIVSRAAEPAFVREGSSQVKQAYQEGVGFEEMLLEELAHSLTAGTGMGSEEGEGGETGESLSLPGAAGEEASAGGAGGNEMLSSLMPHALADGVVAGGGFGLASQLAHELAPNHSAGSASTSVAPSSESAGGTSPPEASS